MQKSVWGPATWKLLHTMVLKINNDEEVTFFILQRLISHHFPVAGSKVVPVPASSTPAPSSVPA